ncbi:MULTISPECIES: carbohydrate ABC transporter permease [Paenibacillus]|uniref:carbohydrate ABC transporter permease n=1 Tax=Paenibacillus TaxID=44249 RepID=UPI0022B8EEF5|nr:carbohydrate ABC transporter permease [Paenibacillus caseinilyticus]MCZ8523496.1 carbohydrate ABC transporter permease [Paenibacillus caseinilyticus]
MTLLQKTAVYSLLFLGAAAVLYPLFYALSVSFMTAGEAISYPPKALPGSLYLDNFRGVLDLIPVGRFIVNSFTVSLAIMLGQLVTGSMAAYAFSYLHFAGKSLLFGLFLSTMMIPWEVTVIPNYLTVKSWDWLDSYQALIVPFLASAFGVFLLRQFFLQLPRELFEAARIDGCGHGYIFLRIVLPLSKPALATLGVYSFLNHWNMYLWPLLVTNDEKLRTVQIGISMLQFEEMTSWNLVLAGVVLVLLPSLLLLLLGLKQLVRGMTAGAVKG